MARPIRGRAREERGQTSVLIIGLALVLLMTTAVVVDASAAYLQRQELDSLADGAALQGADEGAVGLDAEGVPARRLRQTPESVSDAVRDYLTSVGAYRRHPGLRHDVTVDPVARVVTVTLRAPLELPLRVPGGPEKATVAATARAAVTVTR